MKIRHSSKQQWNHLKCECREVCDTKNKLWVRAFYESMRVRWRDKMNPLIVFFGAIDFFKLRALYNLDTASPLIVVNIMYKYILNYFRTNRR